MKFNGSPSLIRLLYSKLHNLKNQPHLIFILVYLMFLVNVYAQKYQKAKDLVLRSCVEYIGNGLYSANFSYDNPNKDLLVNVDDSYVVSNKNHAKSKGVNYFRHGSVEKAFTRQFSKGESVEWTVINPNGKVHTVVASANSSHCADSGDTGFIFPVYDQGNGKSTAIIGSELTSLAEGNAGDTPSDVIFQISNDKVLVEIVPINGQLQNVITLIKGSPFNVLDSDFLLDYATLSTMAVIDVYFPIGQLTGLNSHFDIINFVRPLYPSYKNIGVVTTQGDSTQTSDIVRKSFRFLNKEGNIVPVDGAGITVGVLSDSYDTEPFTNISKATVDIANGDLNHVDVLKDLAPQGSGIGTDEGRAMLQILHDVAPGASLAFHTGTVSPREFEVGFEALAEKSDIIVDDITFITEPFFGVGRISDLIDDFVNKPGKFHFTSAGNFANHAYQGNFSASSQLPQTNFLPSGNTDRAHVFGINPDGSEDVLQKIHVNGSEASPVTYMIVLQWKESAASQENQLGATDDLDIYLVDDQSRLIVGNNRVNFKGDPTEIIVFQARGSGDANIMITCANGTPSANLPFRYIAFRYQGMDLLEYGGAPTVSGHAMNKSSVTVGAVDYRNAGNPVPEYFSSFGGILPDNSDPEIDFLAPDGGNTNVSSIGKDYSFDTDSFPNFYGTSAAAPHAAGAMALLLSALPSWYPDGTGSTSFTTDAALQLFKNTATSVGNTAISGSGLINTDKAFKTIAAQTAKITKLVLEDGKTASAEPFIITIIGEFLPRMDDPNPADVYFDGVKLEDVTRVSDSVITATIPSFTGNPDLSIYTQPKTAGGDGGFSDPVKILPDGTIAMNIIAESAQFEYGQTIEFTYRVEGLPKDEDGNEIPYESLELPEIGFSTPVDGITYPDVNTYKITPYFKTVLTDEQKSMYHINFTNGLLDITKKDLTIKPVDATFTYGDPVHVEFNYQYNPDGIIDNDGFLAMIKDAHHNSYYPTNTLALINRFTAVVNDYDILGLLSGGSWSASERTIQNRFTAVVNGMDVIDLDIDHFTDYLDEINNSTTNRFTAVVNRFTAVVNAEDLLNNLVDLSFENRFTAVVNGSGLGGEDDPNDYSKVFAIIDQDDASTDTEERSISKVYSLDLITGLDVTESDDTRHYVFPGAFLSPVGANFNITYGTGRVKILPATLNASTNDLLIEQNESIDTSLLNTSLEGFVYNETEDTVFPDGLSYYFIDEEGNMYEPGDVGAYRIYIDESHNYLINYTDQGILYVNPFGDDLHKVRTYLDCVEGNPDDPDGLYYIAHFSYENPNDQTIYVLQGADNFLSGSARYVGETPIVFLPGDNTFDIRFDGEQLIWNLTTYESTHKSSVSSNASSSSGKCSAKDLDSTNVYYELYPNPVTDYLYIQQNRLEASEVQVYNMYGNLFLTSSFDGNSGQLMQIDMSAYPEGFYIVRISSKNGIAVYNIIKQ